jgi:hypothetical protein
MSDRRATERIDILGELKGEVMVFQPMTIVQISVAGAQIETPFPLHLDSLHDVRLTLGDRSVIVKGRIVHCRISDVEHEHISYNSGLEFIDPPAHVRKALEDYVEALKVGRQQKAE